MANSVCSPLIAFWPSRNGDVRISPELQIPILLLTAAIYKSTSSALSPCNIFFTDVVQVTISRIPTLCQLPCSPSFIKSQSVCSNESTFSSDFVHALTWFPVSAAIYRKCKSFLSPAVQNFLCPGTMVSSSFRMNAQFFMRPLQCLIAGTISSLHFLCACCDLAKSFGSENGAWGSDRSNNVIFKSSERGGAPSNLEEGGKRKPTRLETMGSQCYTKILKIIACDQLSHQWVKQWKQYQSTSLLRHIGPDGGSDGVCIDVNSASKNKEQSKLWAKNMMEIESKKGFSSGSKKFHVLQEM